MRRRDYCEFVRNSLKHKMKRKIPFFACCFLIGCARIAKETITPASTLSPTPTAGYALVWSDEFNQPDGSAPDPANWNYSKGGSGWGNGELQFYTDSRNNSYIENGMLVIRAEKERYMGCDYTSARLNTMAKGEWRFGRIEIRAKLPETQGIWPAFWLLPSNITRYGGWPASGEIDIMELIGKEPGRAYGTLHFGMPKTSVGGQYDLPPGNKFADGFHSFVLDWRPDSIRWYVDGNLFLTADEWFTSMENSPFPAPFDVGFYLILNVAVGGGWPGYPDAGSVFPQSMYVDYVRVYQE
jgi:beta-glucanase (GH16 family)